MDQTVLDIRWVLFLAAVTGLTACTPAVSEGGFDSDDPGSRIYAVVRAGEQGDWGAVPDLIDELGSADQAVRMYAIEALERITGRRYDYVPYAPLHERHQAINRWVVAYRAGRLTPETLESQVSDTSPASKR